MLYGEEVSALEGDELLQVDQAIEEYADLRIVFLELMEVEVPFFRRLYHVVHLAEQVHEENLLVVQVLKPVDLLLVEMLHFVGRDDFVVVQVDDGEPVAQTSRRGLVFFGEHEPHEVLVAHLVLHARFELARHLVENAFYGLPGERVALIAREVVFVDEEIVVGVQLPEAAVQHVEVLVREVLSHLVDVILPGYVEEHVLEVGALEVAEGDAAVVVHVYFVKYAHHHGVRVTVLKLWRRLQEF